ncbi:MAG: hypothetical protein ACI4MN_03545 [Candidatus Coproplasma sp.]
MAGKQRNRSRSNGSSPVAVGIISFLLGFIFAFIVLIGSIFGVGYVAATTDINQIFNMFGLENVNEGYDENNPDSEKYNYINADEAKNILQLVQKIMELSGQGLGEISLNKIDYLAPITDTVLNVGYEFIGDAIDFDKEYFEDAPLTSVLDAITNSVYYVRTSKVIDILHDKMGYEDINEIDNSPIVSSLIKGVEAQYATVTGMSADFKLPVLYDYYVKNGTSYNRTVPVNGISAYPTNLNSDFICETMSKDSDGETLYKVYYVPCKVTPTGIEEAEYIVVDNVLEDDGISFTRDGVTQKLKYVFKTIEYGEDTVFIAVKPQSDGVNQTFELDFSAIYADAESYAYYEPYARNYFSGPNKMSGSDRLYGITTVNKINYFVDNSGKVIEYDPLTLADIMLDPMGPLDQMPVYTVVEENQSEIVKDIFGDTSLGAVLGNKVDFNTLINKIYLSTFLSDVRVDDKVMAYIVYNISNITDNGNGSYTAIYDKGGENEKAVTLEVDGGTIKMVTDSADKEIKGHTVADLTTITLDLTLDIFLDVKADDAIMAYLGYGIYDVVEVIGQDWQYEATYGEGVSAKTVRVYTDNSGIVTKVTYENGNEIKGTTIDEVNERVDGIMDVLTLPDVIDVDASETIMVYIGYGISDVEAVMGQEYSYTGIHEGDTVYIYVDSNNYITKVTDTAGNAISGTSINGVSARVDNIMDVISIPDLMDIDPEEEMMAYLGYGIYDVTASSGVNNGKAYNYVATYKDGSTEVTVYVQSEAGVIKSVWKADGTEIKGTKANDVSNLLDNIDQALRITEFMDINATEAIMTYVGYGVYGVEAVGGSNNGKTYSFTGKYDKGGVETTVYIATDGNDLITDVWDGDGATVVGTKVGDMPDRIDSLQDKLTIGEIITVNSSSSLVLQAIADSTISGLNDKINTLTIGEIIEIDSSSSLILQALKDTTINGLNDKINTLTIGEIVEVDSGSSLILQALKDTTINGLNDKINTLTIGEIVEVDSGSSLILQALKDTTINGLNDKINTLTIGEIVEVDTNSSLILQALKDTTIDGLDAKIQTLTIGDIVGITDSSTKILKSLADTTIDGLDAKINSLIVSDVLEEEEINSNSILSELKNTEITNLSTEIDKVLIQRIYAEEVYGTGATLKNKTEITYNSEYLYYERTGNEEDGYKYTITEVGCYDSEGVLLTGIDYDNALGKLTEEQFNAGDYYTYGEAKGMWKLVLYRIDESGNKTEKAYTLNNFDYMVNTCSDVVYNSTLQELQDAEIIEDTVNLQKTIKTVNTSDPINGEGGINYQYVTVVDGNVTLTSDSSQAKKIGELSLKQLLAAIMLLPN